MLCSSSVVLKIRKKNISLQDCLSAVVASSENQRFQLTVFASSNSGLYSESAGVKHSGKDEESLIRSNEELN